MATQFQEGYLDELPDYKEPSKTKAPAQKFKEGYLDELEDNVPSPSGTEAAPVKGVVTTSTNPYGKMGADEEVVFGDVKPAKLSPEDEAQLLKFYDDPTVSYKDIDSWLKQRGSGLVGDSMQLIKYRESLAKGRPGISTITYGAGPTPEELGQAAADAVQQDLEESGNVGPQFSAEELAARKASGAPVAVEQPAENWDETIRRKASDLLDPRSGSLTSAIGNFMADPLIDGIIRKKAIQNGEDPDEAVYQAQNRLIAQTRKYRQDTQDYSNRQDELAGRGVVTSFIQDVAADLLGDPAQLLLPGGEAKSIAGAGGRAAFENVVIDAAQQGSDIYRGVADEYDIQRGLVNAAAGAVIGGGIRAIAGAPKKAPEGGATPQPITREFANEGEQGFPGPMAVEGEAGIPGPRFSPKPEPKVTADRVITRVNEIAEKWTNSPEIEVVQSAKELGDDVDPDALGFIGEDGKVRIIADNLQSEDDIPAVLYHEALGHHGLDQKFGEGLDNLLDRMYRSEGFKKTVDDWLEANPQYKDLYNEDANPQARIVEEYLVSLGESGQLPPPNLLAVLKHYLKELGRKMKIKGLEYTDSEVMTIIGMAHNATINGKPNAASNGFRYSMEGQRFSTNAIIDDRFKREDTLLRRAVKKENEKSYEDWKRNWEFDEFVDELETEGTTNSVEPVTLRDGSNVEILVDKDGNWLDVLSHRGPNGSELPADIRPTVDEVALEVKGPLGRTEQFEDLSGRGREGPIVQVYNNEELLQRLANGGPRYMKRKGESEGPQTNFGRRETNAEERPYVPMGNVRSNRPGVISILEEAAPVKDRQTQDEWIAASNEVRKSAKQHQKALNPGSEPAEVLAARDSSLKLANRLTDLSVKIRDGIATDNEKWQLEVGMAQLADLLEAIDGVVSNAGRVLRSMGIEVANDAAQLAKVRALLRNKSNLSADEIAEKLADANFDPNATAQLAKDNFKPSKLDYITSIRYSAMLSGLTTPSKAIVGTMSNMLLRNASYAGSMFTGKVKPGEWQAYNLGMIRSIVEASRAFKESYGLGIASNSPVNRLELQEGVTLPFSKVTEYPRRTLAGIDAFFREIIRGGEVNALAYRQALNEGFTPNTPEFEARADYLVGLPMDEVALQLKNAKTAKTKDKALIERLEEEYKLLRNIDKLATKQANLQQLLDNDSMVLKGLEAAGRHGPVSRFIVQNSLPFARNVDNIARMAGRNSWLGLMSPYVRGELKASPERRALMISQMNVGSLLIGLAGYMGYNELAVPSNSDDRDMAAIDQAMGKTPGSIKIGDEWVSLAGLDAIAVPFITAATTAKAYKDGRSDEMSYAMATLSAFDTMVKAFADETIIGQLEQFTGLFERGSNYSEFIAALPSSFIPAAVRQYTQWGEDRTVLDTRGDKSMTDRAIGRVLAGTPEAARKWLIDTFGLSELPQKLDIFGRPIYREGDAVAAITGVGRGAKEETDPAIREVDRLSQIAGKAAVTKTPDEFTVDGEKVKLTPEQRMKWQYDAGQYILSDIKEAMADPVWNTLSDAEKFEEIKLITKEAKDDAKWDNFRDILETDPDNQPTIIEEDPAVYEGYVKE